MYDYLIVGAGLFGSIFAYEAKKRGKNCLVIDKRPHIGGNIYTKEVEGINVHEYGRIYSIHLITRSGNIFSNLLLLIDIPTLLLQGIEMKFTICLLI